MGASIKPVSNSLEQEKIQSNLGTREGHVLLLWLLMMSRDLHTIDKVVVL
jgi:hypothetical protein